jgi:hypothetical protein
MGGGIDFTLNRIVGPILPITGTRLSAGAPHLIAGIRIELWMKGFTMIIMMIIIRLAIHYNGEAAQEQHGKCQIKSTHGHYFFKK